MRFFYQSWATTLFFLELSDPQAQKWALWVLTLIYRWSPTRGRTTPYLAKLFLGVANSSQSVQTSSPFGRSAVLKQSIQWPVCNTKANGLSTAGHPKVDPHLHKSHFGPSYLVLGQPQIYQSGFHYLWKCWNVLSKDLLNKTGPSRIPVKVQFKQSLGGSSWTEW